MPGTGGPIDGHPEPRIDRRITMATQTAALATGAATRSTGQVHQWAAVNAIAIGAAYGLFALFGGTAEALGAGHESIPRDLSIFSGLILGGVLFAHLRQRTLLPHVRRFRRVALVAAICLPVSFILGVAGGPLLYFPLGIVAVGTVAGAVEWRATRKRGGDPPAISFRRRLMCWLLGGIVAVATVVALEAAGAIGGLQSLLFAMLGETVGDVAHFTMVLGSMGALGGAIGGTLEGRTLYLRPGSATAPRT
jgi:hypothetical protein